MNEGSAKQQIVEAVKANSNILVTVSDSPSVDELSAALGLTILLNKVDKRATSIFSGTIPPAITFLEPEKTLEGTVDSLRDFIIALDKEKADHLRYKVDGDVVKIFITPYRTTLTEKDLQFSQGDYNVELVIALGVKDQAHLDKALEAHGRILHDATVTTISAGADPSQLGSIDWRDATASSLCEMLVGLSEALKADQPLLDEQIATAFLTGIVSATDRFSNDHTSSRVMTMAAQLMAAGANQQLIAAKLQEAHEIGPGSAPKAPKTEANISLNDDKDKAKKGEKKSKKDDGLRIDRADKKPVEKSELPPGDTQQNPDDSAQATTDQAVSDAKPAENVEKQLSNALADTAPPQPPAADDIAKELQAAVPPSEPDATVPLAPAPSDNEMPGFESLEVPPVSTPSQPAEQDTTSAFIETHPGSSYLSADKPASFDAPVDGIIGGANTASTAPIDPFSTPLPPLPELHESKDLAPPAEPETPAPVNVTPDQAPPTLDDLIPPAPTPSLETPPVPTDFSSLPPLPPPPPPPVFDQPGSFGPLPPQSGAISADKLGDIFGDTPPTPVQDNNQTPPAGPPPPGQFQIPS